MFVKILLSLLLALVLASCTPASNDNAGSDYRSPVGGGNEKDDDSGDKGSDDGTDDTGGTDADGTDDDGNDGADDGGTDDGDNGMDN